LYPVGKKKVLELVQQDNGLSGDHVLVLIDHHASGALRAKILYGADTADGNSTRHL